jgi:prepilin-type N-terminal cleavage/methylation domain-containing protein
MQKLIKTTRKLFSKGAGEKGFTLIELLVVVGILGILAGVVTLNLGSFIGTGQAQAASTELHNVQTAVTAYQAANSGAVPGSMAALDPYLVGGSARCHGTYTIGADGLVTQTAYP